VQFKYAREERRRYATPKLTLDPGQRSLAEGFVTDDRASSPHATRAGRGLVRTASRRRTPRDEARHGPHPHLNDSLPVRRAGTQIRLLGDPWQLGAAEAG
jgi:hypothetical protein